MGCRWTDLESVGARATYYTSMSLMDKSNNLGVQFTQDDLHELVERRHELASHTLSHSSAQRPHLRHFRETSSMVKRRWRRRLVSTYRQEILLIRTEM